MIEGFEEILTGATIAIGGAVMINCTSYLFEKGSRINRFAWGLNILSALLIFCGMYLVLKPH